MTAREDAALLFRNVSSLKFKSVVYELGIAFGVSKQAMDQTYAKPTSEADDRVSLASEVVSTCTR
jgi:hypothetical protein